MDIQIKDLLFVLVLVMLAVTSDIWVTFIARCVVWVFFCWFRVLGYSVCG